MSKAPVWIAIIVADYGGPAVGVITAHSFCCGKMREFKEPVFNRNP